MGVGIPGFGFQLPANRLGAGLTFLESKEEQPAQQGLWEPDAAGRWDCIVFAKAPGSREGERQSVSGAEGRCLEHLEPDSRLLFWAPEASPEESASESIPF